MDRGSWHQPWIRYAVLTPNGAVPTFAHIQPSSVGAPYINVWNYGSLFPPSLYIGDVKECDFESTYEDKWAASATCSRTADTDNKELIWTLYQIVDGT